MALHIQNGLEPQAAEAVSQVFGKPERGQRERAQTTAYLAFGDDGRPAGESGNRMRRAIGRRDGCSSVNTGAREPVFQVSQKCRLAAPEVRRARRVNGDAVRRIGGADRRIALMRP